MRLAYLVSHPIQYQAPLLRHLAEHARFDLTTFFLSDHSAGRHRDPGFGVELGWDVPVLGGYRHVALSHGGERGRLALGLARRLASEGHDALWVHGWGRPALLGAALGAGRRGLPVLLRGESVPGRRGALRRGALRALFRRAAALLAIGTANRRFYEELGVSPGRIFDVPYVVDNDRFRTGAERAAPDREGLRASLRLEPGRPIVLYASKLVERKRPVDLLEAYASLSRDGRREPEAALVFVGDGPERARLEARVRKRGWRGVRFGGFRNQSELPALYDLADVFVLPSRFETWGLVLNEAMNAARPVVTTSGVGAALDLVVEGENGYVYEPGDVAGLAERLRALLADPERARRMGRAARAHVAGFDFERAHRGLAAALEQVA